MSSFDLSAYLHEQPDGSVVVDRPDGSTRPGELRHLVAAIAVPEHLERLVNALRVPIDSLEAEGLLRVLEFRSGPA